MPTAKRKAVPSSRTVKTKVVRKNKAPTTRPASRKQSPSSKVTVRPVPKRWGRLSVDLPPSYSVTVDGRKTGRGRLAYLRMGTGNVKVLVKHLKSGKLTPMTLPIYPRKHTVIATKRGLLGLRFVRGEEHEVSVRLYQRGRTVRQMSQPAGKYCWRRNQCWNLFPGDRLYLRPGGRSLIVPTRKAQLAVRPYRARKGDGFLTLHSFPPGVLLLGGKVYSTTPVARLPLKPGTYKAMVLNGFLQAEWSGTLTIKAGKILRRPVYLQKKGGGGALLLKTTPPVEFWIDGRYRGWTPNYTLPLKAGKHLLTFLLPSGKRYQRTLLLPKGRTVYWNMRF